MATKNIKLIFLTGTPILNTPFELVPMFNMLKGYIYTNHDNRYTLFPEDYDEFMDYFIDADKVSIKNANIFKNRITSMVSYYGNFYFHGKLRPGFPEEYPLIIEKVQMSDLQFSRYREARNLEEKEQSSLFRTKKENIGFAFKENATSSSYRIKSRQASNFYIPLYAREQTEENDVLPIYKIKKNDLKNISKFSPKFEKILSNLKLYKNQLSVVYSEFVSGEGINLFTRILEANEDYVNWQGEEYLNEYDLNIPIKKEKRKTYAIISGDVSFAERNSILRVFNSKKNITGDYISILLISKSGAEGLTFKNVRSIHIMEPFWNYARIEQILARGSRYHSHANLPLQDQNIQPYLYISTYPKDLDTSKVEPRTTDEELLQLSLTGKKIIQQFLTAMIEGSIDCNINKSHLAPDLDLNCHLCTPNNKPLFSVDINYDIKVNNCYPLNTSELEAKKIRFNDIDYYYTKNKNIIKVYDYKPSFGAYVELEKSNPTYSKIVKKLL